MYALEFALLAFRGDTRIMGVLITDGKASSCVTFRCPIDPRQIICQLDNSCIQQEKSEQQSKKQIPGGCFLSLRLRLRLVQDP